MASILELLHSEQAKAQSKPVSEQASASARADLQRTLNNANVGHLACTTETIITDSMIAGANHR